jgi:hypothetical protein
VAVALNAERFAPLAIAQRTMLGLDLPIVFLPDPLKGREPSEIRAIADEKYLEMLTHVIGEGADAVADG